MRKGIGVFLVVGLVALWFGETKGQANHSESSRGDSPSGDTQPAGGDEDFIRSGRLFVELPFSGLGEVGVTMFGAVVAFEGPLGFSLNLGGRMGTIFGSHTAWDARLGWSPTLHEFGGSRKEGGIHLNIIVLSGYRGTDQDVGGFGGESFGAKRKTAHNLALDAGFEVEIWNPNGGGWCVRLVNKNRYVLSETRYGCDSGECKDGTGSIHPGLALSIGYVF